MSLENLRKLSRTAFKADGTLRTFGEQLFLFEKGLFTSGELLIVTDNLHLPFEIEHNDLPITMNQSIARKILTKHSISPVDLEDLVELMKDSPLALKSKLNHINVILDKQQDGNSMMNFLDFNKQRRNFTVNDIRSIYFDNVISEMNNSLGHDCRAYVNEKTKKWLFSVGVLVPKGTSHYAYSLPHLNKKTKIWLEKYLTTPEENE